MEEVPVLLKPMQKTLLDMRSPGPPAPAGRD